jgi:hypothetical protein
MTQDYSLDLRARVVAFVEAGHACRAAARHFGVSASFAIKLLQRRGRRDRPLRRGRAVHPDAEGFRLTRRFRSTSLRPSRTSPCPNWRLGCSMSTGS